MLVMQKVILSLRCKQNFLGKGNMIPHTGRSSTVSTLQKYKRTIRSSQNLMEGTAAHFIKLKPPVQNIYNGKTQMRKKNPTSICLMQGHNGERNFFKSTFFLEPTVLRVILLVL